jgi:hypothetical protein
MNTRNCKVSHFESMISLARRKRGGLHSTNGLTGSNMVQPTSIGMSSGCKAQSTTKKLNMSKRSSEHGEVSKMRQDDPNTACAESTDQASAGMLVMDSRTL